MHGACGTCGEVIGEGAWLSDPPPPGARPWIPPFDGLGESLVGSWPASKGPWNAMSTEVFGAGPTLATSRQLLHQAPSVLVFRKHASASAA